MGYPENLRYAKTHEWLRLEGDTAVVGITSFAVEQLGDLVFLELAKVGTRVAAGERVGEVESTKTASEIYAPVSGSVAAVNAAAPENLDLVKDSPYDQGWLVKLKVSNRAEVERLLDAKAYDAHVQAEAH